MARDYAQRGPRRAQTQQRGQLPGWAWGVLGLSIGLATTAFVYIARPAGPMVQEPVTAPPRPVVPAKPEGNGKNTRIPLPPEEKERFTFYEALKQQKVYIPRDERPEPVKPPQPAPNTPTVSVPVKDLYLIQIASFRGLAEAEKEKARLALAGVEARIEKVTVDDRDTYFRVRVGPLERARAEAALAQLQENGIQGMVVKAQ